MKEDNIGNEQHVGAGVNYQCPLCQGNILKEETSWYCSGCSKQFAMRHGVPILDICKEPLQSDPQGFQSARATPLFEQSAPSGSTTIEDEEKFLVQVEEKGWRVALASQLGKDSPGMLRSMAPNRLSWKYLVNLDKSWKVLDIGAGTGGIACQLAKECSVLALDKEWRNAAFMNLRARQDGLTHFEAVAADAISLPLVSDQFDMAVMIGALEWVPFSWPNESPREMQLKALTEISRVLKPGGRFFLGIENARYLGYFLGIPEAHTNLKYISLMDKLQAERLSQDLRGSSYLELTHSKGECMTLLAEAGFSDIQALWLYPDYAFTNYFIPLDKPNIMKYFVEEHLNPWDFRGARAPLYRMYRLLEPELLGDYVEFYGFMVTKAVGR